MIDIKTFDVRLHTTLIKKRILSNILNKNISVTGFTRGYS